VANVAKGPKGVVCCLLVISVGHEITMDRSD